MIDMTEMMLGKWVSCPLTFPYIVMYVSSWIRVRSKSGYSSSNNADVLTSNPDRPRKIFKFVHNNLTLVKYKWFQCSSGAKKILLINLIIKLRWLLTLTVHKYRKLEDLQKVLFIYLKNLLEKQFCRTFAYKVLQNTKFRSCMP